MSKSLLNKRTKKKPVKVSKATQAEIAKKVYGEEHPPITERANFLNWCKAMVDLDTSRRWLDEYLEGSGESTSGVPNEWINPSVCHRARLKSLGAPFTQEQDRLLEEGIREILSHAKRPEVVSEEKLTIQDHIRERFHDVMGEVEGIIDDSPDIQGNFDFEAWCREKMVSPKIASMILAKLRPRLEEFKAIGADPSVKEGYKKWDMRDSAVIQMMVNSLTRMLENEKRARAPRKPKPISVEKKLKHIRESYLRYSKEWNVTSVDPSAIVGAKELWTLNVKYKLLTAFRTDQMGGQLDVSRCKITGFSSDSQTYRLGRGKKQFSIVEEVLKSSKSGLKRVVSELKTQDYLMERVNENTILLRVF